MQIRIGKIVKNKFHVQVEYFDASKKKAKDFLTQELEQYCELHSVNSVSITSRNSSFVVAFDSIDNIVRFVERVNEIVTTGLALYRGNRVVTRPDLTSTFILGYDSVCFTLYVLDAAKNPPSVNNDIVEYSKERLIFDLKELFCCNGCGETNDLAAIGRALYCKKCKENIAYCDHCQREVLKDSLSTVKNSLGDAYQLCQTCSPTAQCVKCEKQELAIFVKAVSGLDQMYDRTVMSPVCAHCVKNRIPCDNCGYYYDGEMCPCKLPGSFKQNNWIREFNYDVTNELPYDRTTELFGVELEVGVHKKYRHLYKKVITAVKKINKGSAIEKYDSSIDFIDKSLGLRNIYRGFEIVTRPMSYINTLLYLKKLCNNKPDILECWAVGTTGIHIHVSKSCLSRIEIGKIVTFMNSPENKDFICFIAKRESERFAKFIPTKKIINYNDDYHDCHYEALNTSKQHTIEFRIFKGTLNSTTLISYLQFVKSLIEFVKVASISQMNKDSYIDYLFSTNHSKFRELKSRFPIRDYKTITNQGEI